MENLTHYYIINQNIILPIYFYASTFASAYTLLYSASMAYIYT